MFASIPARGIKRATYPLLISMFKLPLLQLIREAFKSDKRVETKECNTDLVTETDQECERIIIKHLKETFPTHRYKLNKKG